MKTDQFEKMITKYPNGTIVEGNVAAILPGGAQVMFEDGEGIIRWREMSKASFAKRNRERPALVKGQRVKVLVIGSDPESRRLELSVKRISENLSQVTLDQYKKGTLIRGRVMRLISAGAFIELETGVEGFAPLQEVPLRENERLEEALWPDDIVGVAVKNAKYDSATRSIKIDLSVAEYCAAVTLNRLSRSTMPLGVTFETSKTQYLPWQIAKSAEAKVHPDLSNSNVLSERRRVLIVDASEEVLGQLGTWLSLEGYRVDTARSLDEVRMCPPEWPWDILFLDIDTCGSVSQAEDFHRSISMKAELVLLCSSLSLLSDLPEVKSFQVLVKPIEWKSMAAVLSQDAKTGNDIKLREKAWNRAIPSKLGITSRLNIFLDDLRSKVKAESCVLFQVAPDSETDIEIVDTVGAASLQYEKARLALKYSSIKEVIESGQSILENEAEKNPARYRYLFALLPFQSCIGVPVGDIGHNVKQALFLFHSQPGQFQRRHLSWAMTTADLLCLLNERTAFDTTVSKVHRLIALGQLTNSLFHEINHRLRPIDDVSQVLSSSHHELLGESITSSSRDEVMTRMKQNIRDLDDNIRALRELVRLYQQFSSASRDGTADVNYSVDSCCSLLKRYASEQNVDFELQLSKDIPLTMVPRLHLEQAFLNILMNAVQQTHLYRPSGGSICIETRYVGRTSDRPIQVRFTDCGPGIHTKHLSRLFKFGFTTRPKGNGLGLFITKVLIEGLGGSVSVENTVRFSGTAFLVELPVIPYKEIR